MTEVKTQPQGRGGWNGTSEKRFGLLPLAQLAQQLVAQLARDMGGKIEQSQVRGGGGQ